MFRKQNILKPGVILAFCLSHSVSAQEFYPFNFRHLFTDEGIESGHIAILNDTYLFQKGFEPVNDTLYVQPTSKERVFLSISSNEANQVLTVNYLTKSNLTQFRKRLQDEGSWLVKVNDNLYEMKSKDTNNQFLIDKDSVIDNTRFHHIRFILTYKKGLRFSSSDDQPNFPIQKIYPLQNSTWYFTADYSESQSYPGQNDLRLKLTREKQSNKIEFTDDIHFKVSYIDKNNKPGVLTGTYENGNSIAFRSNIESPGSAVKQQKGIPVKVPELVPLPVFEDPKDFEKQKNTKSYFQFIFSGGYDTTYYSGDQAFHLYKRVYTGSPRAEMVPSRNP